MNDSLTKSQLKACESIHQSIAGYEQRINLWGSPGSGKTFLAHYLSLSEGFTYFHNSKKYRVTSKFAPNQVVIVDNAPCERKLARVVFGDILWNGISNVILITREPINDAIMRINLSLTDDDIEQVKLLIKQVFNISITGTPDDYTIQQSGIWALLKSAAILA